MPTPLSSSLPTPQHADRTSPAGPTQVAQTTQTQVAPANPPRLPSTTPATPSASTATLTIAEQAHATVRQWIDTAPVLPTADRGYVYQAIIEAKDLPFDALKALTRRVHEHLVATEFVAFAMDKHATGQMTDVELRAALRQMIKALGPQVARDLSALVTGATKGLLALDQRKSKGESVTPSERAAVKNTLALAMKVLGALLAESTLRDPNPKFKTGSPRMERRKEAEAALRFVAWPSTADKDAALKAFKGGFEGGDGIALPTKLARAQTTTTASTTVTPQPPAPLQEGSPTLVSGPTQTPIQPTTNEDPTTSNNKAAPVVTQPAPDVPRSAPEVDRMSGPAQPVATNAVERSRSNSAAPVPTPSLSPKSAAGGHRLPFDAAMEGKTSHLIDRKREHDEPAVVPATVAGTVAPLTEAAASKHAVDAVTDVIKHRKALMALTALQGSPSTTVEKVKSYLTSPGVSAQYICANVLPTMLVGHDSRLPTAIIDALVQIARASHESQRASALTDIAASLLPRRAAFSNDQAPPKYRVNRSVSALEYLGSQLIERERTAAATALDALKPFDRYDPTIQTRLRQALVSSAPWQAPPKIEVVLDTKDFKSKAPSAALFEEFARCSAPRMCQWLVALRDEAGKIEDFVAMRMISGFTAYAGDPARGDVALNWAFALCDTLASAKDFNLNALRMLLKNLSSERLTEQSRNPLLRGLARICVNNKALSDSLIGRTWDDRECAPALRTAFLAFHTEALTHYRDADAPPHHATNLEVIRQVTTEEGFDNLFVVILEAMDPSDDQAFDEMFQAINEELRPLAAETFTEHLKTLDMPAATRLWMTAKAAPFFPPPIEF